MLLDTQLLIIWLACVAGAAGSSQLQAQGSQLQRALRQKKSAQSASTVWSRHTLSLKVRTIMSHLIAPLKGRAAAAALV